ncbi:hypothetical protein N7474_004625 [Penicillium riverlandense]|uniref:uncharacterized protein n=1 Tax=Penicillium riverlandense TaxID=1903569 RepID=UPI002547FDD4|nr:uncharacterized protein N7474_004625 [Penicillium riverlandense]KAJ5819034.1 hypothetical protein N7474_004625 [Penicillium riverlandense]
MASRLMRAVPRSLLRSTSRNTPSARYSANSAKPGQSSNVSNPIASSPESQAINKSRGLEGRNSDNADTRSTQSPISSSNKEELGSETHEGEEQTSTDAQIKNDPAMPTEAKRKNVEKAGQKPLGPEDHK